MICNILNDSNFNNFESWFMPVVAIKKWHMHFILFYFFYLFILKILAPSGSPEIGGEEGGRGDQDGEYM